MHTSPHPQPYRRTIFAALMEVVKIDLIVVPAGFVVAIAFWIIGLGSQLPYSAIPEWAFALWATVSGLSVSTLGFDFSLVPSLVTVGLWLLVATGAKRVARSTAADSPTESDEDPGGWWALMGTALGTFVVAYAGPLLVVGILVGQATVTPLGFLRLFLFLVTAVAWAFIRVRGIGDIPGLAVIADDTWNVSVGLTRRLLWAAAALGAIVLVVGIMIRWSDVADTVQVYSSPVAAGIGLIVVQALFAPSIVYSALSWSAGTGVSIGGAGTSSAFTSTSAPVLDVHVLQLLDGDYPAWTAAAPALLVLLGLLCVILGRDRARDIAAQSWMGLGLAIGILFVALEVIALFAGGALGPLGLSGFGPSALTSALAITGWIGVGMAAGLLLIRLSRLHAEYSDFAEDDEEDADYEDDTAGAFDEAGTGVASDADDSEPVADDIVDEDEPR
ncbi:DUF6350 family protein [Brevibacterium iodinum]|nr:DUF6350 family protein [Brevibacterium iodinum]